MIEIETYLFKKNARKITTSFLTKKDCRAKNIPTDDCICLHLESLNKCDSRYLYIRPDEALLIARMLINAVWKSVKAYKVGFLKWSF